MTNAIDRSRLMTLGAVIAALAGSLGAIPQRAQAADGAVPAPAQKAASGSDGRALAVKLSGANAVHARGGHKKIDGPDTPGANAMSSSEAPKKRIRIGVQKRDATARKFDPPPSDSSGPPTAKGSGQERHHVHPCFIFLASRSSS